MGAPVINVALYRNVGGLYHCRGCGMIYEPTAAFAAAHRDSCRHLAVFDALVTLNIDKDKAANVACLLLGEVH